MKFLRLLIYSFFLIATVSCTSKLNPKEYIQWVDDTSNGMIKEQLIEDVKLTCKHTPSQYVVLKQFKPSNINVEDYNIEVEAIENMVHFILRFEKFDGTNLLKDNYTTQEEFQAKSMYLSYDIRMDLKLVQGLDTTMCVLNHHERTYSNTPYEQVLLSFPKVNNEPEDMTLIFDDRVFGFNRVKFFFAKEDLENLPEVVIEG